MPSPILKLDGLLNKECECNLYIKRESLIHQDFGGNKWRKLKYNIEHYLANGYTQLVTFGGPFSNHIAATSAICNYYNIPSVGIIRGNYIDDLNPTLIKAKENNMILHHISKDAYKLKSKSQEFIECTASYKKPFIIPEGGSNEFALLGVAEMVDEIYQCDINFDYIVVSAGTGTTALGILTRLNGLQELIVVNALKNEGLSKLLLDQVIPNSVKVKVCDKYHFGGFAKVPPELIAFCNNFYLGNGIKLDPIYNAKTMFGILDQIKKKEIRWGSNILMVETGGTQGITAFNYRAKSDSGKLYLNSTAD